MYWFLLYLCLSSSRFIILCIAQVFSVEMCWNVCHALCSVSGSFQNDILQNRLNEIFSKLAVGLSDGIRPPATPTPGTRQDNDLLRPNNNPPAYEVLFPELYLY